MVIAFKTEYKSKPLAGFFFLSGRAGLHPCVAGFFLERFRKAIADYTDFKIGKNVRDDKEES